MTPETRMPGAWWRSKEVRRFLACSQAALLLGLGVTVPMLDRVGRSPTPVLESEHNPSTCVMGHDHTVCTQLSSNRVLSTDGLRHWPVMGETLELSPQLSRDGVPTLVSSVHRSRAPPLG